FHPSWCGLARPARDFEGDSFGTNGTCQTCQDIPSSSGGIRARSALHHVDREAAEAGFLVALVHVEAGLAHRLDHLVEADPVRAVADQSEARGLDRLDRADRIPFDAGHLD